MKNQKQNKGASTCRHVRKDRASCHHMRQEEEAWPSRPMTVVLYTLPFLPPTLNKCNSRSTEHRNFTIQNPPVKRAHYYTYLGVGEEDNNEGAVWAWKASLSASGLGVLQPVNARFAGDIEVFCGLNRPAKSVQNFPKVRARGTRLRIGCSKPDPHASLQSHHKPLHYRLRQRKVRKKVHTPEILCSVTPTDDWID